MNASQTRTPLYNGHLMIRTPLLYGQFPVHRQNSHTFPPKNPLYNGQQTLNLSPREQIVDNLRYVPISVGGYTNIDNLSFRDINTRTCQKC